MPNHGSADGESGGRQFWKIEVVVWANAEQVSKLSDDIELLLCPEPDHQPPCPIPWEMHHHEITHSDPEADGLRDQVAIEYPEQ